MRCKWMRNCAATEGDSDAINTSDIIRREIWRLEGRRSPTRERGSIAGALHQSQRDVDDVVSDGDNYYRSGHGVVQWRCAVGSGVANSRGALRGGRWGGI